MVCGSDEQTNTGLSDKGWCNSDERPGSYLQWADINGDGKPDMICDDSSGNHWAQLSTNCDGIY